MIHQPGIVYAKTPEGLELPVIDLTHPAFALPDDPASRESLLQQYSTQTANDMRGPVFVRRLFMRLGARRSQLLRALMEPEGSYLGGLTTYLMKLGPDHLPDGFNTDLDRRIVGSPHARLVRLRLQQCARLLTETLEPLLAASPIAPLHFISIGGGPAMDVLNALLFLARQQHGLLARSITIHVFDLDTHGPGFGAYALAALQAQGAPLEGLDIRFERVPYNWNETTVLEEVLERIDERAIIAASSEGALFEYGSDAAIIDNLRTLHGTVSCVVGSVTSDAPLRRQQIQTMRFALHPRGVEGLRPLASQADYAIALAEITPLSDQVLLLAR